MTATDPYDLDRFVQAQDSQAQDSQAQDSQAQDSQTQDSGRTYDGAVAELRAGRKTGHWMWFVFPQIAGLGYSPTAQRFAIRSMAEATAYLRHPVLGPRLTECALILTQHSERTAEQIFGSVDATKLRSSMTLFRHAGPDEPFFDQVLGRFFGGQADPLTSDAIACAGDANFRLR